MKMEWDEEEEIIEELTTRYGCDGFSEIMAEKTILGEWHLKFHTWDGHVFEMLARDVNYSPTSR